MFQPFWTRKSFVLLRILFPFFCEYFRYKRTYYMDNNDNKLGIFCPRYINDPEYLYKPMNIWMQLGLYSKFFWMGLGYLRLLESIFQPFFECAARVCFVARRTDRYSVKRRCTRVTSACAVRMLSTLSRRIWRYITPAVELAVDDFIQGFVRSYRFKYGLWFCCVS